MVPEMREGRSLGESAVETRCAVKPDPGHRRPEEPSLVADVTERTVNVVWQRWGRWRSPVDGITPPQWVLLGICEALTRRGSVQQAASPAHQTHVMKTGFYRQTFSTKRSHGVIAELIPSQGGCCP